jgi:hypothetical protein
MDFSPRFYSPGRVAVAAVLAFRPFIAGAVTFADGIAPELAHSITAFLAPATVFPYPLDFRPKALPLGTGVFVLDAPDIEAPDSQVPSGLAMSRLRLTSAAQDFGHHLEMDVVTVPTNAPLLEPASSEPLARLMPYAAAAVLLAEEFGVGTLQLPEAVRRCPRSREMAHMLQASGLSLSCAM